MGISCKFGIAIGVASAGMATAPAIGATSGGPAGPLAVADDRARAISCMTSAIVYEAGVEPRAGQEAVAEVILNRLRNRAFPKTVCGVVFQGSQRRTGCQFSFTCDGSLRKLLPSAIRARAQEIATQAIDGLIMPRLAGATHYHADYVAPYWAPSLVRVGTIGRHIFYRQPGATVFSRIFRYAGSGELLPAALASARFGTATASPAAAAVAAAATQPTVERFMPWGLPPVVNAQPGSNGTR